MVPKNKRKLLMLTADADQLLQLLLEVCDVEVWTGDMERPAFPLPQEGLRLSFAEAVAGGTQVRFYVENDALPDDFLWRGHYKSARLGELKVDVRAFLDSLKAATSDPVKE
jgi:hypothetical protein